MKSEMNFEQSMQRLEEITEMLESNSLGVDDLTKHLKETQQLLKRCKDKLLKTDQEIKKMLDEAAH